MAKAAQRNSTRWVSLREMCEREPPELLVRRLRNGERRARGLSEDGTLGDIPAAFWGRAAVEAASSSARSRVLNPADRYYKIEIASPPMAAAAGEKTTRRRRYRRDQIDAVMKALWPKGMPETTSTPDALNTLGKALDRHGISASRTTQLRAIGRRR
jgi:hypothetical protein